MQTYFIVEVPFYPEYESLVKVSQYASAPDVIHTALLNSNKFEWYQELEEEIMNVHPNFHTLEDKYLELVDNAIHSMIAHFYSLLDSYGINYDNIDPNKVIRMTERTLIITTI